MLSYIFSRSNLHINLRFLALNINEKHSLAASTRQEFFCHEQKFLGPSR